MSVHGQQGRGRAMAGTGWVGLPKSVSKAQIAQLDPGLIGGFAGLVKTARLQLRITSAEGVRLRAGGAFPPFFRLVPLQDSKGAFLPDAQQRVQKEGQPTGLGEAIAEPAKVQGLQTTLWGDHELAIASELDTVAALVRLEEATGPMTFYRLMSTDALKARLFLWSVLTELSRGTPIAEVVPRSQKGDRLVSGLIQVAPASFFCPPLLARTQPLAAVFITAHTTQIVALPPHNAFVRPIEFKSWPIGLTRIRFGGPGKGLYDTPVRAFPSGHAEELLRLLAAAGDRTIHHLTAPERYVDDAGLLDVDQFWLVWSSILFGLDAITSLGAEWQDATAIWTAFRALSILQGLWLGSRERGVPLWRILDPRELQAFAIPRFPAGPERDWASGVVRNYETDLVERFPAPSLEDTLKQVAEVRNLLHGVVATRDRTRRLRVLERIDEHAPNLQLVNEVAAFWWMSLLMAPEKVARPGSAPWE